MNCIHLDWAVCAHCFRDFTREEQAAIQQLDASPVAFAMGEYRSLHMLPADKTVEPERPLGPGANEVAIYSQVATLPASQPEPAGASARVATKVPKKSKKATDQGSLF